MKDFSTIFSFYFRKQVKSKGFKIITILMCLIAVGSMVIVNFSFKEPEKTVLYVVDRTEQLSFVWDSEQLKEKTVGNCILDYSKIESSATDAELEKSASKDEKSYAVVSVKDGAYELNVIDDNNVNYTDISLLQSVIIQLVQNKNVEALGISQEVISQINPEVTITLTSATKQPDNMILILILFMIMVMFTILYSTSSSTEVSYLKTNRVMEIFSTSVKPLPLYLGVNLATSVIPFIQVVAAGVCMVATKKILHVDLSVVSNSLHLDLGKLDGTTMVIYLLFFLLGFYVYSFMITALVSIISKAEDITTISVPVAFIGMAQYFIGITIMEKDGIVGAVASYIPLTSSVMFFRYGLGYVGTVQALISLAILAVTVVLFAYLGAGLFKRGASYYGNLKEFKINQK